MFTHILAAVDGSEPAKRVVLAAADLAQRYGARLTFIHVLARAGSFAVPEELKAYAVLEHTRITEHDLIESAGKEILGNAEALARKNGVKSCETLLKTGDAATHITDYVRNNDVDLVVLGRRGLGDLAGIFLGSVSHKVAQATTCNCLTVS